MLTALAEAHADMGSRAFIEAFEDVDSHNYRAVYEEQLLEVLERLTPSVSKAAGKAFYAAQLGTATGGIDYDKLAKVSRNVTS